MKSGLRSSPKVNYRNVESKVKKYREQIRLEEAQNKASRIVKELDQDSSEQKSASPEEEKVHIPSDCYRALQDQYNELLFRYAEAKNHIDYLRITLMSHSDENITRLKGINDEQRLALRRRLNRQSFVNDPSFSQADQLDGFPSKNDLRSFNPVDTSTPIDDRRRGSMEDDKRHSSSGQLLVRERPTTLEVHSKGPSASCPSPLAEGDLAPLSTTQRTQPVDGGYNERDSGIHLTDNSSLSRYGSSSRRRGNLKNVPYSLAVSPEEEGPLVSEGLPLSERLQAFSVKPS
ncbi:unnamed protein product, partial [Cyprideis torosa]